MHRLAVALVAFLASVGLAAAEDRAPAPSDAEKLALTFELQECVTGKLRVSQTMFQLKAQLDAANKRADEAEASLKAKDEPGK